MMRHYLPVQRFISVVFQSNMNFVSLWLGMRSLLAASTPKHLKFPRWIGVLPGPLHCTSSPMS